MARRVRRSRADNQRWNQMISALRLMNFAFNNIRLYPPTHSEVVTVLGKLMETLTPILEEQDDVGFGFMDELLYIEGAMSIEETANNQMLVDRFSRCRVKYLTLMKGLTQADLLVFFQIINAEATKPSTEHPAELLEKKGVSTIHIVEADIDDLASKSKLGRKKTLLDWYVKAVTTLGALRDEFRDGKSPDLKGLYRLIDDMTATIRSKGYEPYLLLPALAHGLDPHLCHSVNVAVLSCALADLCRLNSGQINTLVACAFLHDLGRLTIPTEWTEDHSPLSPSEREVARQHADWGFLLLARDAEIAPETALLAATHHDLPRPAAAPDGYFADIYHKIIHLADAYDLALGSDKYYWKQRRRDRVLKRLLNHRGAPHDPALLKALTNLVGYYPPGSLVRLTDGQRGIVVRPNSANAGRPKVFLFEAPPPERPAADDDKTAPLEEPPPLIADLDVLAEGGLGFERSVAAVLDPAPRELRVFLDCKKEYLLNFAL